MFVAALVSTRRLPLLLRFSLDAVLDLVDISERGLSTNVREGDAAERAARADFLLPMRADCFSTRVLPGASYDGHGSHSDASAYRIGATFSAGPTLGVVLKTRTSDDTRPFRQLCSLGSFRDRRVANPRCSAARARRRT